MLFIFGQVPRNKYIGYLFSVKFSFTTLIFTLDPIALNLPLVSTTVLAFWLKPSSPSKCADVIQECILLSAKKKITKNNFNDFKNSQESSFLCIFLVLHFLTSDQPNLYFIAYINSLFVCFKFH